MNKKRVFRAFGAPQAPKIFACGAKKPLKLFIFSILEIDFRLNKNSPPPIGVENFLGGYSYKQLS